MSANSTRVLIIGAGHAGGSAAALLRQYGFAGEIVLAGEEAAAPYQRPPLSKAWLKGEAGLEDLLLRPEPRELLRRAADRPAHRRHRDRHRRGSQGGDLR